MVKIVATAFLFASLAAPLTARPAPAKAPSLGVAQADCDALSTEQRFDPATLRDLGPAHSLEAAAAVLAKHGIKFVRSQGYLSLDGLSPRELRDIATLPQGEPIILPNAEGSAICVLRPSADSI
ncbi:hypothetical protein [Sphingomonas crusticola]|uniref:hypothetical protein n=1 Tax=Sphingomonas crusticola TaxID=1697973 RepID=UPI000E265AE8|nr:hypothetical protein [Sphingomonas crusticola]